MHLQEPLLVGCEISNRFDYCPELEKLPAMSDFIKVATTTDIPDPGTMLGELEDRIVVLVHLDGQYYCLDDVCTHDGGPLADGTLDGCELICPRHGARFDVRTGEPLSMPATEATVVHEVRVDGDDLFVRIVET